MTSAIGVGLRVLVVEDEALIAAEICIRLERRGAKIVGPADTAAEAIRLADVDRPDLVLMDIRLKGPRDGIAAAEEIYRRFDLPVVFLTANADDATFKRAQMSAQYGYVLKPFHERDLLMAIELAIHRHRIELDLRAASLTHATISAAVPDAIVVTDVEDVIRFANPGAEELTGWLLHELVGLPFQATLQLVTEGTRTPVALPVLDADHPSARVPASMRARAGQDVSVDVRVRLIINADGRAIGAVWTLRDIRNERRADAALRQSEKLAAVEQLAAGISHEFNNLLTVICGSADLLLDSSSATSAEDRELLLSIREAAERAAVLTNQLLYFSRRSSASDGQSNPNESIAGLEPGMRHLLGASVVTSVELDPAVGCVPVEIARLDEVLLILLRNARDAMPLGGRLTVSTRRIARPRGLDVQATASGASRTSDHAIEILVEDTGEGIPAGVLPRIFEPFFTTKGIGHGSGLGLPTAFSTIEQAGGQISAESVVNVGTTIRIVLPECARSGVVATRVTTPQSTATISGKILVVDDDPTVRTVTAQMLVQQGFAVYDAASGTAALELLAAHGDGISVLLTDMLMPGMNGIELTRQVRRLRPELPVVLVSGMHADVLFGGGALDPNVTVLSKPFTRRQLERAIRSVLDATS